MRIFAQDKAFYRPLHVDPTEDRQAEQRLRLLRTVEALRAHRSARQACRIAGIGVSTYYEWRRRLHAKGMRGLVARGSRPRSHPGQRWTRQDARRVISIRREMPWCGKVRITQALAERHPHIP